MVIIDEKGKEYNIHGNIKLSFPELKSTINIRTSAGQLGYMVRVFLDTCTKGASVDENDRVYDLGNKNAKLTAINYNKSKDKFSILWEYNGVKDGRVVSSRLLLNAIMMYFNNTLSNEVKQQIKNDLNGN